MSDLFQDKNIAPMLMHSATPFDDADYIYELKLDGVRCIAYLENGTAIFRNKRNKDVTAHFPELKMIGKCAAARCILDGELICTKDGAPDFFAVQKRLLTNDKFKIELLSKRAAQFVAYDILYVKNKALLTTEQIERKAILERTVTEGEGLSVSRFIEREGVAFFNLAKSRGLEGVVAKRKSGLYHLGKRTRDWQKFKVLLDEDLIVCGYKLSHSGAVKDVILASYDDENLVYRGSVSLAISRADSAAILAFAKSNTVQTAHFENIHALWLRPHLVCTVRYMQKTANGGLRQPVFVGLRTDKTAEECTV